MSIVNIEFLKISGSFDGKRGGTRWFSLPNESVRARCGRQVGAGLPGCFAAPKSGARVSGAAKARAAGLAFLF